MRGLREARMSLEGRVYVGARSVSSVNQLLTIGLLKLSVQRVLVVGIMQAGNFRSPATSVVQSECPLLLSLDVSV